MSSSDDVRFREELFGHYFSHVEIARGWLSENAVEKR